MSRSAYRFIVFVAASAMAFVSACVLALTFSVSAVAADSLSFNQDIRSILVETCFSCHGADSAGRKADLRLDKRDDAVESGAIVPGDVDSSVMLDRIFSYDPDEVMPPPSAKKPLSAEHKELLKRWIAEGAEYEPHWSFIPPTRPEPPAVKNEGWIKNPIDRFILARLEGEGLTPAPEADRRTLARRLSLDLTGLPPEPAIVEAFVADPHPGAYDRLVDTMLSSLEWGEHRGRHWLDYARYGDTNGIHMDNYREIWTYRQWVVNAFNRNMPFDQFTILQLAGDLVTDHGEAATPEQILDNRIASGFNRCNMTTNEGGVIPEEYAVLYTRDRTETTAAVWMGLTAGCAVCHNHKFDPLSQKEFYELAAFFNNTTQNPMDGNVHNTPPILPVPLAADGERWAAIEVELVAARRRRETARQEARQAFGDWIAALTPQAAAATAPQETPLLAMPLAEGTGSSTAIRQGGKEIALPLTLTEPSAWIDGPEGGKALLVGSQVAELPAVGDFEYDQPFTVAFQARIRANNPSSSIVSRHSSGSEPKGWWISTEKERIECSLVQGDKDQRLHVWSDRTMPVDRWVRVAVTYDGSGAAAGVRMYFDGEPVPVRPQPGKPHKEKLAEKTIRTDAPLRVGGKAERVAPRRRPAQRAGDRECR